MNIRPTLPMFGKKTYGRKTMEGYPAMPYNTYSSSALLQFPASNLWSYAHSKWRIPSFLEESCPKILHQPAEFSLGPKKKLAKQNP